MRFTREHNRIEGGGLEHQPGKKRLKNASVHLFIQLVFQRTFTDSLPCSRHCSKPQEARVDKAKRILHSEEGRQTTEKETSE